MTDILNPIGTRWLLGLFEGGLFPGVAYYLSWYVMLPPHGTTGTPIHTAYLMHHSWYKRSEFGLRLAIFFSAGTVQSFSYLRLSLYYAEHPFKNRSAVRVRSLTLSVPDKPTLNATHIFYLQALSVAYLR